MIDLCAPVVLQLVQHMLQGACRRLKRNVCFPSPRQELSRCAGNSSARNRGAKLGHGVHQIAQAVFGDVVVELADEARRDGVGGLAEVDAFDEMRFLESLTSIY